MKGNLHEAVKQAQGVGLPIIPFAEGKVPGTGLSIAVSEYMQGVSNPQMPMKACPGCGHTTCPEGCPCPEPDCPGRADARMSGHEPIGGMAHEVSEAKLSKADKLGILAAKFVIARSSNQPKEAKQLQKLAKKLSPGGWREAFMQFGDDPRAAEQLLSKYPMDVLTKRSLGGIPEVSEADIPDFGLSSGQEKSLKKAVQLLKQSDSEHKKASQASAKRDKKAFDAHTKKSWDYANQADKLTKALPKNAQDWVAGQALSGMKKGFMKALGRSKSEVTEDEKAKARRMKAQGYIYIILPRRREPIYTKDRNYAKEMARFYGIKSTRVMDIDKFLGEVTEAMSTAARIEDWFYGMDLSEPLKMKGAFKLFRRKVFGSVSLEKADKIIELLRTKGSTGRDKPTRIPRKQLVKDIEAIIGESKVTEGTVVEIDGDKITVWKDERPADEAKGTAASKYLQQKVNFGGEMVPLGHAIKTMQKQGTQQKYIDRWVQGAMRGKKIRGEVTVTESVGIRIVGKIAGFRLKLQAEDRKEAAKVGKHLKRMAAISDVFTDSKAAVILTIAIAPEKEAIKYVKERLKEIGVEVDSLVKRGRSTESRKQDPIREAVKTTIQKLRKEGNSATVSEMNSGLAKWLQSAREAKRVGNDKRAAVIMSAIEKVIADKGLDERTVYNWTETFNGALVSEYNRSDFRME